MTNILKFPNPFAGIILIVEDCEELQDIMIEYIRDKHPGLSIETASDGMEGLDKIAERMPSILITNINMPRMNGITLLKTLQERGISLPTLATSGWWTQESLEKEFVAQGFAPEGPMLFLHKPFQFGELGILVEKLRKI